MESKNQATLAEQHAEIQPHGGPIIEGCGSKDESSVRIGSLAPNICDIEEQRSSTASAVEHSDIPVERKNSHRRSRFVLIKEVEDPTQYPDKIKWTITAVISVAGSVAPFGSSIILPSLSDIAQSLDTTLSNTTFSVGVYTLALGFFPLFWSSFCESLGRRPIYLVSFTLMVIFNAAAALSTSIGMFTVMRLLAGGSAASVHTVGAGTLADIWHTRERGHAMGFFYLGPLCGPLLAPIIGGLLQTRWGWRSTMWFMTIVAFVILNLLFWCQPETLKGAFLTTQDGSESLQSSKSQNSQFSTRASAPKSVKDRGKKYAKILKRILYDPFTIVKYLRFPAVAITICYASIAFGSLYLSQISVQITFSKPPYNFTPLQIGLSYISSSVGYILASVMGGSWADKIMAREAKKAGRYNDKGELIFQPEDRMRENAWLAAIIYPCALIWFGWTLEKGVFYIVPLIANFFFGAACMLVFSLVSTMLTEFMPKKASSGIALNNLVRNIFSFTGSVIAEPAISTIGSGWLFTCVGAIALASSIAIWAMRHCGPRWRAAMDEGMTM